MGTGGERGRSDALTASSAVSTMLRKGRAPSSLRIASTAGRGLVADDGVGLLLPVLVCLPLARPSLSWDPPWGATKAPEPVGLSATWGWKTAT